MQVNLRFDCWSLAKLDVIYRIAVTADERHTVGAGLWGKLCIYDNDRLQHLYTFDSVHQSTNSKFDYLLNLQLQSF